MLLLMDANGKVHIHKAVKEMCFKHHILCWYSEPNMSHKLNVVDRSIGKAVKDIAGDKLDVWLDEKANRKKWTRKKISAKERRLLAVECCGQAWQAVATEEKYLKMRKSAWEATGALITADGSEDALIRPQGLSSWPGPHPPGFNVPAEWNHPQHQAIQENEAEGEEEEEEEESSDTDKSSDEDSDEESDEESYELPDEDSDDEVE